MHTQKRLLGFIHNTSAARGIAAKTAMSLVLTLGWLAFVSSASAATIFNTDFSDYSADFFSTGGMIVLSESPNSVQLGGTTVFNSSLSNDFFSTPVGGGLITLVVDSILLPSAGTKVQVLYYDVGGTYLGPGVTETPISSVVVGENIGIFAVAPPAGGAQFRYRFVLANGSEATLDDMTISAPVPEPGTATLLALGLCLIGRSRRRDS